MSATSSAASSSDTKSSLREAFTTVALVAAGVVCVMGLQNSIGAHPVYGGAGDLSSRGRRLAGTRNEYAGATRSIGEIWLSDGTVDTGANGTATGNGMSGPGQLISSTVLVLVLGSLAAGAGIGGGGLFVPIYMTLLGAGPKGAVPLSKATILGGAVGNFLVIGRARHPKTNRPLIDYESSTLMQSGELLGVVGGALLNNLLPAILIVIFLVCILSYNSYKTLKKGINIRKKETKAFAKAAAEKAGASGKGDRDVEATPATVTADADQKADAPMPEVDTVDDETDAEVAGEQGGFEYASNVDAAGAPAPSAPPSPPPSPPEPAAMDMKKESNGEVSAELAAIIERESKQYPCVWWIQLASMTAFTLAYSFIRKVIQRDPNCQEWAYWLWYVTPVPILGGFMAYTAWLLSKRHKEKVAAGFQYLPADMQWDSKTLAKFPKTALLAGVTAGLLGIGGGMVIGPLFLSIGMEPQVGTSSCAFMILWTAFSGVVIYGVDENLGAELACWCVGFGFISGQIGQRGVNAILKKTGRPSYVVFLLGTIIGVACIAMAITLIIKMAQGDYDANDVIEPDETPETHMFYTPSGFGCAAYK